MISSSPNTSRIAQLSLSGLCFCIAVAIIGTAADTLHAYKSQRNSLNPWWLPLWPDHFNTRGVPALIGTGAAIAFLQLLFLALSSVPKLAMFQMPNYAALLAMLVAVPGSLLSLFGLIFVHVLNSNTGGYSKDTIMTWTCRFRNAEQLPSTNVVDTSMSNDNFGKMCDESRFSYYGMIPILVLQVVMVVNAVFVWKQAGALRETNEKAYSPSLEHEQPYSVSVTTK